MEAETQEGISSFHARISARWIPVLRHFMADFDEGDWPNHRAYGLHIEPHEKGGVNVMATTGQMLAVVHDTEGTTTKPIKVSLPIAVVDACEPPKLPLFFNEGEWLDPPEAPGWMHPQWLRMFDAGVWVESADPDAPGMLGAAIAETGNTWRIGREYRVYDEPPLPWNQALPSEDPSTAAAIAVNPLLLARICLAANSAGAKRLDIRMSDANQPIGIEFVGVPEITVSLMPMRTMAG